MVLGMKQQRSPNTYTPKERNLYLTGLLGQNMIYNIIGTGLVFYFQSVLFIRQWRPALFSQSPASGMRSTTQ